jgi:hypothetical protein
VCVFVKIVNDVGVLGKFGVARTAGFATPAGVASNRQRHGFVLSLASQPAAEYAVTFVSAGSSITMHE